VGVVLNAFFPIAEGVFVTWVYVHYDKSIKANGPDPVRDPQKLEVIASVTVIGTCLCEVISGWVLINSVLTIKKFLSSNNSSVVNIKTLLQQSAAFLLFLIGTAVYGVAYTLYTATEGEDKAINNFMVVSLIALQVTSFISQCLICVIFRQLSEKTRIESVEVAEFDQEAELQARMWN
jgi:hypothetical protein